jgi:hypothetical protein
VPRFAVSFALLAVLSLTARSASAVDAPAGYKALFNGTDLTGWHGVKGDFNPEKYATTPPEEMEKLRAEWAKSVAENWKVDDGDIFNAGQGVYLTTDGEFTDYELLIDYKTVPLADSGIYLKHTPQVQIWDWRKEADKWKNRADFGSGSLWNNSPGKPGKDALVLADKPLGEWNHFKIRQTGARTSVWLNGKLVVNHALMENYWDKTRKSPLRPKGPIQLQTHGGEIRWKNVFIKELTAEEANAILEEHTEDGYVNVFNSQDFTGWQGATDNYEVVDGAIQCKEGKGGVLYTADEYADFKVQLEFRLPPGGNNGLAIRYPGGTADAAYIGMTELQVLDTEHERYTKIDPRQAHGSVYGMIPAYRGYLRPTGEWNFQEVTVKGTKIKVELNGNVILDADVADVKEFMANKPHPGRFLSRGYFGFAGHNEPVAFRRILIKKLD